MRIVLPFTIAFIAGLAACAANPAHGQVTGIYVPERPGVPPDENVAPTIELTVSPAREPRPALQYRLLPALHERTPGNAAPRYYRAIILQKELGQEYWQKHADNYEQWHGATRDAFPKQEIEEFLAAQRNVIAEIKAGASREYCDWGLRPQDLRGMDTIEFVLLEIQECRSLARTLQLQARYETLSGRPEEALELIRAGYQLARDTAEPPYLISALVGIAINSMMNAELLHVIEHSDINFYWAICSLPDPLVDMRPAMQFEANMPFQMFPFLKDAETAHRSPEEWRRLVVECMRGIAALEGGASDMPPWQAELTAAAVTAKLYPAAKEQLIAGGMDRDRVEAMPVGQVIAIQTARSVQYAYDETFKLSLLPYREAIERLSLVEPRLREEGYLGSQGVLSGRAGLPITAMLLPAVQAVTTAEVRLSRNVAVLKAIEALRMHAAEHGRLPQRLADVKIVPVPNNPATGEPFPYAYDADAGKATLDVPPVGHLTPRTDGKRYVIKLKSP